MLASVVVNNHNYGRFVRAAIDSALAQTHHEVEVIVVDDGSTDDSQAIIATYGERITPIFKPNGGQASAINAGVARSQGEIIFLLDSDDILEPDIVEQVVTTFEADPDVVWVMFRLEVIDREGRRTGVLKPPAHMPRRDGYLRESILSFPFDLVRMATSGNAFSASVLRTILPIPEAVYFSGADWYVSPLAGLFGRCVFLEDIGGGYRLHGGNDNWFERPAMTIDLAGIRKEIRLMDVSATAIQKFAGSAGAEHGKQILSVSYLGARMVSLKVLPAGHPLADDTVLRVLYLGIIATLRRFDVRWPMKVLFIGWFALMSLAPRQVAVWLAEMWYFPGRRGRMNAALRVLHLPTRRRRGPATGTSTESALITR